MLLTHKTEIFPTSEQIKQLEINFGLRRFFFNKTISTLKHKYKDLKENKKLIKKSEVMGYRKDIFRAQYKDLLKHTSAHVLDCSIEDVMFALDSLWKKGRDIKLRSKRSSNTFRIGRSGCKPDGSSASFKYNDDEQSIRLPKIGFLKMAEKLRWENKPSTIRAATVKKQAGRYFISISCELEDKPHLPNNQNRHLGIDWGIKTYITAYDGNDVLEDDFNNDTLIKLDKRIAKYQRSLTRKERFSNNWLKTKTKLEQAYLNFNNYRLSYIYEIVHDIHKNYDSVTLEDLGMTFVTRNRRLAHKAKQKPFYMLKIALINKFAQYGKKVYLVPKNYPSTQTCNSCGNVKTKDEKMKLGESLYICKACGHEDDRDHNAAKNLYSYKNLTVATLES